MLFDVPTVRSETCACAITNALRAQDPTATVDVKLDDRRVRVEGQLSARQALAAIHSAGFAAAEAPAHSGPGSTCCGGCS
jgi:copper chaperone